MTSSRISAEDDTVVIRPLESVIEAEVMEDLLMAHGIRVLIRRFDDSLTLGPSASGGHGEWGELRVLEGDAPRAREVIETFLRSRPVGFEM